MSEPSLQAQADAAAVYEAFFVPALFHAWADRVAEAAQLRPGERVLARAAAVRVSPGGAVAGLDLHPGMLAVAERVAPEIAWRQGTAEALPLRRWLIRCGGQPVWADVLHGSAGRSP